jgi:cytochrome c-type biogenesis protein CcmH
MKQIRDILILGLLASIFLMSGRFVRAQDAPPAAGEVTADEVNAVARELWGPLCSGVRLDTGELKACEQMRQEIALKLAAGEDAASIKQYFLEQYGPQILGEPPRAGFNWLAWILPVVALGGGALFLVLRGRHLFYRSPQAQTAPADVPMSGGGASPGTNPEDRHARQLEEELKRYG